MELSIVSPVYNAENSLNELVHQTIDVANELNLDFEIILVNDSSLDNSWSIIEELTKKYSNVKGINLSRNFGQHYAITAGLDYSKGNWVVVMDCDLQDEPREIINFYLKAQDGYDVVLGQRINRQDKFSKRLFSMIFYRSLGYLTGTKQDETIANFGIYNRKVIDAIC